MPRSARMRYYPAVGPAIPRGEAGRSRVTHPFAGCGLLRPLDLHVLSTPPAFVLSQDQTLQEKFDSSSNAVSRDVVSMTTSGISLLVIVLSLRHTTTAAQTRAIARMSHSIVKQQLAAPKFPGNGKYNRVFFMCKGANPLTHPSCCQHQTECRAQPISPAKRHPPGRQQTGTSSPHSSRRG
jgi:hypothetical protein